MSYRSTPTSSLKKRLTPVDRCSSRGSMSASRGSICSVSSNSGKGLPSSGKKGSFRGSTRTPIKYNTWTARHASAWKRKSLQQGLNGSKEDSSNVHVMIRIRPRLSDRDHDSCLEVLEDEEDGKTNNDDNESPEIESGNKKASLRIGGDNGQVFTFDRIFADSDGQDKVFLHGGKMICQSALDGFNASIFAYGQTGSGKTHTMLGDAENQRGLIPRVLEYCFLSLNEMEKQNKSAIVTCSFVEIYNEQVFDLLDDSQQTRPKQLREDIKKGIFIEGVMEPCVQSLQEAMQHIETGMNKRRTGKTNMNRESSRSHSIFTLNFEIRDEDNDVTQKSKINLIDLAGSERQRATAATGDTLNEAKHINKSLSALGNVISALVERSRRNKDVLHIPYRDSSLTYLLRDSLGRAKLSIIATVAQNQDSYCETLSTIQFAQRVKHIKVVVKANTLMESDAALRKEILKLREDLEKQKRLNELLVEQAQEEQSDDVKHGEILAQSKDFLRIENAVKSKKTNGPRPSLSTYQFHHQNNNDGHVSANNGNNTQGERILRNRLGHLERVLVYLLQELTMVREQNAATKEQVSRLEQKTIDLKDSCEVKDLRLQLQEQKLKALVKGGSDGEQFKEEETLQNLKQMDSELQLRADIETLKAENAALSASYKKHSQNMPEIETLQKKNCALQVQLDALLDDKSELEKLLKRAKRNEEAAKKKNNNKETSASDDLENDDELEDEEEKKHQSSNGKTRQQLEKELKEAIERANKLEDELFVETEKNTTTSSQLEKFSPSRASKVQKSQRRFSAGDVGTKTPLAGQDKENVHETDAKVTRAVMLCAAEAQKSARKERTSMLMMGGGLGGLTPIGGRHSMVPMSSLYLGPGSPMTASSPANSLPAPEFQSPNAAELVQRKLMSQLTVARKKNMKSTSETKRLSARLQRKEEDVRKMRKSLTAKETILDMEETKLMDLQTKYNDLEQRYNTLSIMNNELREQCEHANAYAEYQSQQKNVATTKLKKMERQLKSAEKRTQSSSKWVPGAGSLSSSATKIDRFSNYSTRSSLPAPLPRDSNQTIRMSAYDTGFTRESSVSSTSYSKRESSISVTNVSSPRGSLTSHECDDDDCASRRSSTSTIHTVDTATSASNKAVLKTKSSVAEFFPESKEAREIIGTPSTSFKGTPNGTDFTPRNENDANSENTCTDSVQEAMLTPKQVLTKGTTERKNSSFRTFAASMLRLGSSTK